MIVGRAGDRSVGRELPEHRARRGVEAVEAVRVRADVHPVAPDGRRRVDIAAGRLRPAELAARGAERVDLPVRPADVDAPVGNRRCPVEVPRVTEARLGLRLPEHAPGRRVQCVDVTRIVADEEPVARDRDAALHLPLQLRDPAHLARAPPQRPHPSVPVAGEHRRPDDERRRLGRADRLAPAHLPVADSERDHLTRQFRARLAVAGRRIEKCLVDHVAVDGGRCRDAPM